MFPIRDTIRSRHPAIATKFIILVNVLVFGFQLILSPESLKDLFNLFGMVPARFSDPAWADRVGYPSMTFIPFLTSMFLHGGWLHIISNMWALWIFGDNVEDRMGTVRFALFYLVTGIIAGVVHWKVNPGSTLPTIGASGAIAGVMGAYFIMYPRSTVITVFPIFFYPLFLEIPAVAYLGIWFLTQLFSGAASLANAADVGGVAWWAHLGGFISGIVLHFFFKSRKRSPRRLHKDEMGWEGAWRSLYR